MRGLVKEFLYYNFSENKTKAETFYNELTKEQEFDKLYTLFKGITTNKEIVKKIKKKLYSISFKDITNLVEKEDTRSLEKYKICYNEKEKKWNVPAEVVLLGALNDLLGPYDRITPLSKEEILNWALGEKRRDRTAAGITFLGTAALLAMYPFLYNFSNYMYGIPALFYWYNLMNLAYTTVSRLFLEENLRNGYWRLNACRKNIVHEILDIYNKENINRETFSLENILEGVQKRKQDILERMVDDRVGNKEKSVKGVLDWELFLSKFDIVNNATGEGIFLAVFANSLLSNSSVLSFSVLGPLIGLIVNTGIQISSTIYQKNNISVYGKGKETFKEKISKMNPEEAIWEILTFLNKYKERKIKGNKLSMLYTAFGELLGFLTVFSNPNTILDIGMIGFLIGNAFNFYQPIVANRGLKKEKTRTNEFVRLREKIKLVY